MFLGCGLSPVKFQKKSPTLEQKVARLNPIFWADSRSQYVGLHNNSGFRDVNLLIPFIQLQRVVPFGGLLLFFVLFLGVVRNPNVPYFLRFNALQALLTDIVVKVLSFAFSILLRPIGGGTLLVGTLSSTVVIAVLAILVFAIIECLRGREPDLPGLSQAVRMQLY